jgi:hypothetical protein
MIQTDILRIFAEVAIALAGVSGIVLVLARQSTGKLAALDRARLKVLFYLTLGAFVLAVVPMFIKASGLDAHSNLRASSATMAGLLVVVMGLARLTYSRVPRDERKQVPGLMRGVFYTALLTQFTLAGVVGAGLWQPSGMAMYVTGLTTMLLLALLQFSRLLASDRRD